MSDEYDYTPEFDCEECGAHLEQWEIDALEITDEGYWSCPNCGHTHIG